VLVGINAGFGRPLGEDLDLIHALGFAFVRQDIRADRSDADVLELLGEFHYRPLTPLVLLAGGEMGAPDGTRVEPHVIAAHGARVVRLAREAGLVEVMIEVGNEPDIGHVDYRTRPQDFATAVRYTFDAVRDAGFDGPVISGGISNLSRKSLDYLERAVEAGMPSEVIVGFHRYPRGMSPAKPQEGFDSREDEWQALQRLAHGREVACTEMGHHTAPRPRRFLGIFPYKRRVSDEEVADHVEFDLKFFAVRDCLMAAIYQLNDGHTDNRHVDRYGIRRRDGTLKPVAERIAQLTQPGGLD
jgi:hypothetical protein